MTPDEKWLDDWCYENADCNSVALLGSDMISGSLMRKLVLGFKERLAAARIEAAKEMREWAAKEADPYRIDIAIAIRSLPIEGEAP